MTLSLEFFQPLNRIQNGDYAVVQSMSKAENVGFGLVSTS